MKQFQQNLEKSERDRNISEKLLYTKTLMYFYNIQIFMPRKENLSALHPNRYYNLQATLKYTHQNHGKITAIIEQDNVQKKIMLPQTNFPLQLGASYNFDKCFYSKNGWIKLNQSENIKLIEDRASQYIELNQIFEKRAALNNSYVSTIVQVINIGVKQTIMKNGEELSLIKMQVFGNEMICEVTIWNQQIDNEILGKMIVLSGFRVKTVTPRSVSLISTVYSALHIMETQPQLYYNPQKNYQNISQIYIERSLVQMSADTSKQSITHSLLKAKVSDVMVFDYDGCAKCRKKNQTNLCADCGQNEKGKFVVVQILLQDQSGQAIAYVFDQKLLGVFKLCKKGTVLEAKIKSTQRIVNEQENISHIITGITSIYF